MNWLKKALTYIKKGYNLKKKDGTFQSRSVPETERLKYKLYHSIRSKVLERLAPVLNHKYYDETKDLLIDLVFTGLVIWFITWALFSQTSPRMGFGIAVTISVVQYYIKWYYTVKPKTFAEINMKK